jgi:hypothetical protein
VKRIALISLALCALLIAYAWADIPTVTIGPTTFTSAGVMPIITLSGQSACAITLSGSGTAMLIPYGSSDSGNTYSIVPQMGARSTNGTFGSSMTPYLTNFYVEVALVSGTVNVTEACSSAVGTTYANPSPTPTPAAPPTPTPSPTPTAIPTPPTPTPAPPTATPSNFPQGVLNDGPLAYYRLDDGSSVKTFADSSGNGYAASATGTFTSVAGLVVGDSDTAEDFNLSGGYGIMPSTMTDFHTTKFSLMWLGKTPNTVPGSCCTYSIIQYYGVIGSIVTASTVISKPGWTIGTLVGNQTCQTISIPRNTAYFFVETFDITTATPTVLGSLNGGAQANCNPNPAITKAQVNAIPSFSTRQYIATSTGQFASLTPPGIVDEATIFPYVLTLAQIQTLATLAGY